MENKKFTIKAGILIGLIALLSIGTYYLVTTGYSIKNNEEIKIGVILPQTGKTAYIGEWASQGIELARKELEGKGKNIKIIYENDACDPKSTVNAMNKLVQVDNVKVIIGPECSSSVLAAAPIAEKEKVIIFSNVATSSKITDSGEYVFRNRESDALHGKEMADFAFNKLGKRKAGILYLNLDNGIGFEEAFKKRFTELGGEIVAEESYELSDPDFKTQLTKIKKSNPDVLYFAGQRVENAVVEARELGMKQQILGPSTIENKAFLEVVGNAGEGIIYTNFNPDAESIKDYQESYKEAYNKTSEAYAANSYDALMILTGAIELCSDDTVCIKDYLYKIQDYNGVSGSFSIDKNGDANREIMFKTVKGGEFVNYEN
jgi:branched-chain amino acid transport system substrate-binding protein